MVMVPFLSMLPGEGEVGQKRGTGTFPKMGTLNGNGDGKASGSSEQRSVQKKKEAVQQAVSRRRREAATYYRTGVQMNPDLILSRSKQTETDRQTSLHENKQNQSSGPEPTCSQ